MVFFVRITVNQSHLRPICKSTKFNPKIQRTIYSINFQRLRLHVLGFIRTVVVYILKILRIDYSLLILSTNSFGVSISIFENPNHFLPKSLMDAPM